MPITITNWAPVPGRPLPIPQITDDRDSLKVESVKELLLFMERNKAVFMRFGHGEFEEAISQGITWRIQLMKCPLKDKRTNQVIANHRFICARSLEKKPRILVGPYVGCFAPKAKNDVPASTSIQ